MFQTYYFLKRLLLFSSRAATKVTERTDIIFHSIHRGKRENKTLLTNSLKNIVIFSNILYAFSLAFWWLKYVK